MLTLKQQKWESWNGRACPALAGYVFLRREQQMSRKVLRESCFFLKLRGCTAVEALLWVLAQEQAVSAVTPGQSCSCRGLLPAASHVCSLPSVIFAPFNSCRGRFTFKRKATKSQPQILPALKCTMLTSKDFQSKSKSHNLHKTLRATSVGQLDQSSSQCTPALFLTWASTGQQGQSRRGGWNQGEFSSMFPHSLGDAEEDQDWTTDEGTWQDSLCWHVKSSIPTLPVSNVLFATDSQAPAAHCPCPPEHWDPGEPSHLLDFQTF